MDLPNMSMSNSGPPPPPLPPRPTQMGIYDNGFGGSGIAGYGGYSQPFPMNTFGGGYGGMYNQGGIYGNNFGNYGGFGAGGFGVGASPESNFVRIAEEQSRGAFQSIESVVNAVASVANMLSSTHNAVFSSFRAVIGVVEQFSLLKAQLGGFVFITLVKWLRWVWRTLLVHMGLKPKNYNSNDQVWNDINQPMPSEYLPGGPLAHQRGFNWAAAIFWIIALGGPYLIYKAVSQMVAKVEESRKWATGDREHYSARALYDFNASSSQELSFRTGDILRVAPKSEQPQVRGWLLASSDDGQRVGLVPINYVKLLSRQSASPPTVPINPLDETAPRASPPVPSQQVPTIPDYNNYFQTSKQN